VAILFPSRCTSARIVVALWEIWKVQFGMNRPLVLDAVAKAKIGKLKAWAQQNRKTFHQLKRIMEGLDPPVGDEAKIFLASGYSVAYCIEQQPLNKEAEDIFVWCHHLSVAVSNDRKVWPNVSAIDVIAKEFGFSKVEHIWLENEDNDEFPSAVNLISREATQ
jgi:hypothetical protein